MKVSFLGPKAAFDYHGIGGVNTVIKRMIGDHEKKGDTINIIYYGEKEMIVREEAHVRIVSIRSFYDAIKYAEDVSDVVNIVYIGGVERVVFSMMRTLRQTNTVWNAFVFGWQPSLLKRQMLLLITATYRLNGVLYCSSNRLCRTFGKLGIPAVQYLPKVPSVYMPRDTERMVNTNNYRIAYMGRFDFGKGVDIAFERFCALSDKKSAKATLYGYWGQNDQENEKIQKLFSTSSSVDIKVTNPSLNMLGTDVYVSDALHDNDLLFLPYRRLESTVDTPLLLVESIVARVPVIFPKIGDLTDIYGSDEYALDDVEDECEMNETLLRLLDNYKGEVERLNKWAVKFSE